MRPEYYTDPSTIKAVKARLAGGTESHSLRAFGWLTWTWRQDATSSVAALGSAPSPETTHSNGTALEISSIVKHEDTKKHQKGEEKYIALQRSIGLGFAEP